MKISIADVKAHLESFVRQQGLIIEGMEHNTLMRFATFIEGKQAEADAQAYLISKGYTITPPAAATPPPAAG